MNQVVVRLMLLVLGITLLSSSTVAQQSLPKSVDDEEYVRVVGERMKKQYVALTKEDGKWGSMQVIPVLVSEGQPRGVAQQRARGR